MKTSDKGLLEIAEHEGIVPAPYRDSRGIWTYGIGHTAAAGDLDPREMNGAMPEGAALDRAIDRAIDLFRDDVVKYEDRVNSILASIPRRLKQHEFDALVSWDFNCGGITWRSSRGLPCRLVRELQAGDFSGDGFMGWLKPPEIRKRRTDEQRLFQTGDYDANGDDIPIWSTNGAGRLTGIIRTMDGEQLLARMRGPKVTITDPPVNGWSVVLRALAALFKARPRNLNSPRQDIPPGRPPKRM